ncbi:MAG: hypothetical protein GXP26_00175 [Planctomycetes bacterium]|nr:hypothetical protein [Planctomycetota bacterium]
MSGFLLSERNERAKLARFYALAIMVSGWAMIHAVCSAAETAQEFSYRRIFVPVDTPEKWPVGSERYIPISSTEFSQLIDQSTPGHRPDRVPDVRLTSATYTANFATGNMLEGSANLDVHLANKSPRFLPLTPLNFVITSSYWQQEPTLPVNLALWSRGSEQNNELGIYVEQSGTLHFEWQLQAIKNSSDDIEYDLKIPSTTPQTFSLTLPSNRTASVSAGELISTEDLPDNKKRWLFQLGPSHAHRLSISQLELSPDESRLARVSQVSAYRLDPQGLSLTSRFRIDAHNRTAEEELRFSLPDGIRVLSVTIDKKEVEWQTEKTATGTELTTTLFASSLPQTIEIHSLSRIVFDETWRLPSVRLRKVTWTEGTSSIQVAPALELLSLVPQHASLENIVGLGTTAEEESYRLQEWTEEATFEVVLGKRSTKIRARTATILDLDPADIDDTDILYLLEINPNDTTARTISVLTSQGRPIYQLEGKVAPGWSIEAIKTSPSNALREWHVYQKGKQKLFRLQLDRPLKPGEQLRIECDSRATKEGSLLPATASELIPVRFTSIEQTKRLLLLRSQKRGQLQLLHGLDRARLQIDTLSAEDAALLPESADGALIDLARLSKNTPIKLLPRSARYRAEVNVEVSVLPDEFVHQYQLDCTPLSGIVSELVIAFDEPLPKSTQWEVVGQSSAIVAQRLDQASVHGQGVLYLIRLPVAIDTPFHLRGSYSTPAADTQKCNLIHLPDAEDWQGQLVVHGPLNGTQLDDRGWIPIASPEDESSTQSSLPVIGSYRLGADRAGIGTIAATLTITRNIKSESTPNLIAWLADIQSSLSDDGTAIYVATYHLENSGASGAEFELPPQAKLQNTWLNQQQLDPREVLADDRMCRFHFSDQRRYPTIAIQYVLRGKPLGHSFEFQPKLPRCSYPIKSGRWTLWTPEHFAVESFSNNQTMSPLDWSARLLGPLHRAAGEGIFNPLRADDWRRLWFAKVDHRLTRQSAERALTTLNEIFERGEDPRWRSILHAMDSGATKDEKLHVDRSAFEDLGIRAESRLSEIAQLASENDNATALATTSKTRSPLERCGLSLVATPNLTVLTSQQRTSQWRDQLRPTITPNVFRVSSKSLALRLERIAAGQAGKRGVANGELDLVDVNTWTDSPKLAESPWSPPAASLVSDIGRRAATLEFAETPPVVVVQREYGQRAEWYAIWLLALVASCRQLARFPRYLALAIAISAAACLVVPLSWLTAPQAIFLGLLSSVVLQVVLPKITSTFLQPPSYRRAKRPAFFALLVGASLISGFVFAEPAEETGQKTPEKPPREIHRLLIPVDTEGNTQGEDIYLPETFLHTLLRNQGDAKHDGAQCVLRSVQYRGVLPAASPATTSDGESWTILLDVESFVTNGQLFLPFIQDEAEWIDSAHRLNGFPVVLNWEESGKGCSIELDTVGNYQLELSLRPKVSHSSDRASIRLHTPAIPGAKLLMTSINGFQDLSIPTAGRIDIERSKHRLQTVLSASDTLEVTWSASPSSNNEAQSLGSVDQRSWLHIEPTAARLDVQLQLHRKSADSRRFLLVTSPGLKLLPPKNNSILESAEYLPDQRHTLEIVLKQNVEDEVLVPLQFQLQRTVSVGRIDYPWVKVPDFTLNRSLLAVSVLAGLSYDENLRSDALSIQATDFATEWKTDQEPPLYAYALGRGQLDGSLRIWPDPKTLVAQQAMKVHCQLAKTFVTYEASVNEVGGSWLTYRLRIPKELQITEVTVQQQPSLQAVPVRWHRLNNSRVVVLLGQPMQEPHLLILQGYIKTPSDGTLAVPSISLVDTNRTEMRFELSREPEVLVSLNDPHQALENIPRQSISRGSSANLVGRFVWRNRKANDLPMLQIKRNNRQFDADMVTTLTPGPNGWTGTAHTTVKVQEGMIGQLQFTVPDTFQKPYRIEPASLGSVHEQPNRSGRRLVTIQLQNPVSKDQEISFRLTGSINLTADQRLMVPDLRLTGTSRGNRYVLLPTRVGEKSINWDWPGLTPEPLPLELGRLLESQDNTRAFRVEHEQFFARERSYQGTLQNAIWRHALISGVLDHEGNLSATAELVLQPGRATHCTLRLPENAKLTQLVVGDSRVRREKTTSEGWRIPLGPPYLPRRITVSYQTQIKTSKGRFKFQSPILLIDDRPLPSPEIRWKIRPVGQLLLADPIVGHPLAPEQFSRAALQLSLHAIADSRLLALELPKREGRAWFKPWQRRTQQAWEEWRRLEPASGTLDEISTTAFGSNHIEHSDDSSAWATLLEQLGAPNPGSEHQKNTTAYPPILPGQMDRLETRSEKFFLSDDQGQVVLRARPISRGNGWRWLFAVLIVSVCLPLARQIDATTNWAAQLREQRAVRLLAAIGILWWLLLTASAAGLLLVVAALLSFVFRRAKNAWRQQVQSTNSQIASSVN